MIKQLAFALILMVTIGIFVYTAGRLIRFFRFTRQSFPVRNIPGRFLLMLQVAFGQTKMFRMPIIGFLHALVFWGFCVILLGSIEMIIDGLSAYEKCLGFMGGFYDFIMASGDVFACAVTCSVFVFLARRIFLHVSRFNGIEMKALSHLDANIALTLILLLMISLLGMNVAYVEYKKTAGETILGSYPVSARLGVLFTGLPERSLFVIYEFFWWTHIILIFLFANILPYSKHFHVFLSVPNVFLSRLEPLGKLPNMDEITREVRLLRDPNGVPTADGNGGALPVRFGVKDVEDVSWKNYFDSLTCTECGRCTAVCPANITGKTLSPRKIMMDVRARMKEKGPGLIRNGTGFNDHKSLLNDYITREELWACTTCNACATECPVNINHPTLIVEMRRFLVLEEAYAPGEIKSVFSNIENNGAPWQYSPEDRLNWTASLMLNT